MQGDFNGGGAAAHPSLRALRVLVVDSKAASRSAVCALLRECNYTVRPWRRSSGRAAPMGVRQGEGVRAPGRKARKRAGGRKARGRPTFLRVQVSSVKSSKECLGALSTSMAASITGELGFDIILVRESCGPVEPVELEGPCAGVPGACPPAAATRPGPGADGAVCLLGARRRSTSRLRRTGAACSARWHAARCWRPSPS
jgi:hypothetical protein